MYIQEFVQQEEPEQLVASIQEENQSIRDLYESYGNISFASIKAMPEARGFLGTESLSCEKCEKGKASKPAARPSSEGSIHIKQVLQKIYADLVGPFRVKARGYKYALVVMDDYSRYTTVVPLKTKSEVGKALITTINHLENVTSKRVSQVQVD